MTRSKTCALLILLAAAIAGCSSTPINTPATTATTPAATTTAPATAAAPKSTAASTVATVALPEYLDPKSPLATGRSVYFDFDDFSIRPQDRALIERHGKYLASHAAVAIKIEGNADERGSAEYNLALGQKRAEAVLRALKIYGVKDSQMEPVSWGEERPKATGHDEAAWAQNRRADLQYPSK